jgi:hypothetical protein
MDEPQYIDCTIGEAMFSGRSQLWLSIGWDNSVLSSTKCFPNVREVKEEDKVE